jgi:aspartate-semialdehyde dehydrogenase|tara:strand:- start:30848 stop:31981 length:1134 start_codon:yes stop_codon:yes gene_type:complete
MSELGRMNCAILGSRGLVAQRYLQRMINHNWLVPVSVIGSASTVGLKISELPWSLDEDKPELPDITVKGLDDLDQLINELKNENVQIIFSAIPDEIALRVEKELVREGFVVISHALINRMDDDIPLVIPDVNPNDLTLLNSQELGDGFLISCSNCMVVPIALTLSPLMDNFDFSSVNIVTEQSLSGGGRGMLSKGRLGMPIKSVIPGESESIIRELNRILDRNNEGGFQEPNLDIKVLCSRVNRDYGHLAVIEIDFKDEISAHEIIEIWQNYSSSSHDLRLPSSTKIINFIDGKLDVDEHRWAGSESREPDQDLCAAMAVSVGEIEVTGKKLRFKVVSDNTIRGAAGYGVLLAELLLADGILHDSNTILDMTFPSNN